MTLATETLLAREGTLLCASYAKKRLSTCARMPIKLQVQASETTDNKLTSSSRVVAGAEK